MRKETAPLLLALTVACVTWVSCSNGDAPAEVRLTTPGPTETTGDSGPETTQASNLNLEFTPVGPRTPGLVDIASAPGGGFYMVYRHGVVKLARDLNSEGVDTLVLDDVVDTGAEQGLLAVAVHPDGQRAYIDYTAADGDFWDQGDSVLVEYAIAPDGTFDVATRRDVLVVPQPSAQHHMGELEFGPDGYLYVGVGDGSIARDPQRVGLDRSTLLGKILRIDPTADSAALAPLDNPFVADPTMRPEIWSYGLRNPWRFTFDPANGDLWITDVGQAGNEEVNVARAKQHDSGRGVSFGWSAYEGNERFHTDQPAKGHRRPVYTYHHENNRCAITGAALYRGERLPLLDGGFVFADFCTGEIWATGADDPGSVIQLGTVPQTTAVRQIGDELYVLSLSDGLYRADPA